MEKSWTVEYTDEFEAWWLELAESVQDDIDRVVSLLEEHGPTLGRPYSPDINGANFASRAAGSRFASCMRLTLHGRRCCFSAATRRGTSGGTPRAERIFAEHLKEIEQESQT